MRKLIVLLILTILSQPVFASNWKLYFENKSGARFYIDRQSVITLKNGHTRLWEKQVFAKPDKSIGSGILYLFEIDCVDRKFEQKSMIPIEQTAHHLKTVAALEPLYVGKQDFEPNDLGEQRLKNWCGINSPS